jgi:hypothetical protein
VSKAGGGQGLIYLQRENFVTYQATICRGGGWGPGGGVGGARGVLLVPPLGRREVLAWVFRDIMSALVHVASAERHGGQAGTWGRGGF